MKYLNIKLNHTHVQGLKLIDTVKANAWTAATKLELIYSYQFSFEPNETKIRKREIQGQIFPYSSNPAEILGQ